MEEVVFQNRKWEVHLVSQHYQNYCAVSPPEPSHSDYSSHYQEMRAPAIWVTPFQTIMAAAAWPHRNLAEVYLSLISDSWEEDKEEFQNEIQFEKLSEMSRFALLV